jgi:DNA-binding response OmpR family regulator
MKILVVEDDSLTREGLSELLLREGYTVEQAKDGADGLRQFKEFQPDLVCLDVMMPNMSGYDLCREIRKTNTRVPLIFITAKSEEIDTVVGLELGADDYIAKPFGKQEVLARVRALIRRAKLQAKPEGKSYRFTMDELEIVPDELRAYRGPEVHDLSPRDIAILEHLFQNRGRVIDRDSLFDAAWGSNYLPNSRSLDQHISQLRKRIEKDPKNPAIIKTVHGAGYRFE